MADPWSGMIEDIERVQSCKELCLQRRITYSHLIDVLNTGMAHSIPGQHALHGMVDAYDELWHAENPTENSCPIILSEVPMAFPFMLIDLMEEGTEADVIKLLHLAITGTIAHEAMHERESSDEP